MAMLLLTAGLAIHAQDIQLSVVPDQMHKLRDGGKMPTESFMFYLIVNDRQCRKGSRVVESKADLTSAGPEL